MSSIEFINCRNYRDCPFYEKEACCGRVHDTQIQEAVKESMTVVYTDDRPPKRISTHIVDEVYMQKGQWISLLKESEAIATATIQDLDSLSEQTLFDISAVHSEPIITGTFLNCPMQSKGDEK